MKARVLNETYNPLLKRKEIRVEVEHDPSGTPNRATARQEIATLLGGDAQKINVIKMVTLTGTTRTVCEVELYDDPDRAKKIVRPYLRERELPKEERERAKAAKEAPKKEEPKKEAKKEKEGKPAGEKAKPEQAKPKPEAKREEKK